MALTLTLLPTPITGVTVDLKRTVWVHSFSVPGSGGSKVDIAPKMYSVCFSALTWLEFPQKTDIRGLSLFHVSQNSIRTSV